MTTAEAHARRGFVEPDLTSPLDLAAELAAVPRGATISGMFLAPLLAESLKQGYPLPSARSRYVAFRFYPLTEHVALLAETAQARFARMPLRKALRKLGRGAPAALLESTLGRVVLGAAEPSPLSLVEALAKSYGLNLRPGRAEILEHGDGYAMVGLRQVHYFLDCHHVGAFEAAIRKAGATPRVLHRPLGRGGADLLCSW